jgi:predicted house-cleaning noncanonical NTP pyrophosphatase (MazG superfamily)
MYYTVHHNFSGLAERPTRHQDLSEFFQTSTERGDELRDELRDEVREELRDELRDEQRDELSNLMTLLQDKNRQGGIVGLFETISKLHADTGNNFSVTRHLQQDETGQLEEDDENSKKPGMSYWTTWSTNT